LYFLLRRVSAKIHEKSGSCFPLFNPVIKTGKQKLKIETGKANGIPFRRNLKRLEILTNFTL